MSARFSFGVVVLLVAASVGGVVNSAQAWERSRLSVLAAKQDLRDEVCIALALDRGKLTANRRYELLADAKRILTPKEYESFRVALDRLSPPPRKSPTAKMAQAAKQPRPKSLGLTRWQAASLSSKQPTGPVIPQTAALPDRPASGKVR